MAHRQNLLNFIGALTVGAFCFGIGTIRQQTIQLRKDEQEYYLNSSKAIKITPLFEDKPMYFRREDIQKIIKEFNS